MNDTNMTVLNVPAGSSSKRDSLEEEHMLAAQVRKALRQPPRQLLRSQEWFDFASDGYLVTDLQGVVHEANYAAARLFSVRKDFLLGKPLGLFVAEECHVAFYKRLARMRNCDGVEQWEARVSGPHGQPRWVMLTAGVYLDEEDIKLRWALHDVTELRQAQQQALQAERLAVIGQMAAGLAHEGRNALQRIQACLALLTLRLHDRPEELGFLDRIQKAQDDLQRLFEDVRSYAVAPRLNRRWHDLRQIWCEAWNELANLPEWRSAELCEDIDGVDPSGEVDAFYLKHVFRNLLENALSCGASAVRIVIHCRPGPFNGKEVICLRLCDNGPGIPAEIRPRLFEPFCTTKAHGTGLGLAICKRIIEAHGGHIEANGNGASGAEITITLPRRGT
jgi:PAS domain S-box-containing protein